MTSIRVHESEVWCRRCDQPSVETVNGEAYCREHALTEHWKANSPSWNPERTMRRPEPPMSESEARAMDGNR